LCFVMPTRAQDGFNLPSELYILTNDGVVERYGIGAEGMMTVTPEGDFVLDMGVAPDGNWLAYRTEDGLSLIDMFSGESMLLDIAARIPPIRGRGDTLAWTTAGDALAYTTDYGIRVYFNTGTAPIFTDIRTDQPINLIWSPDGSYLASEIKDNIWWIFRREGTEMILASAIPSSMGTAWISDSQLVFAPESGGLIVMDMEEGNQQTELRDNTTLYRLPYQMPNGALLVFSRSPALSITLGAALLVNVDVETGDVLELGEEYVDTTGLRWAPDGSFLTALQGGVIALVNHTSGAGLTLPMTNVVAYGWGALPAERVSGVTIPVNASFLARGPNNMMQVWRMTTDGTPPVPLTAAQADIVDYVIAPDKRSVAYISGGSLWLLALSGASEPQELAPVELDSSGGVTFSPDGQTIAYIANTEGAAETSGVWTVTIDSGEVNQLLPAGEDNPQYTNPRFAPNINAILVTKIASDQASIGLLDLYSGELNPLGVYSDGRWLDDGRILAAGSGGAQGTTGLALIDPAAPEDPPVVLLTLQNIMKVESVVPYGSGGFRVALTRTSPGPNPVQVVDIAGVGDLLPLDDAGFIVSPMLAPDGSMIAGYTHEDGALIFYDLADGTRVTLKDPMQTWRFRWSSG
jgi:WD40 repeat protein